MCSWTRLLSDGTADSGARDLERSIGTLLDGVAMRGSLGTGPEALRLEDVLATNGLVLFKLDAQEYPHATRKVASWLERGETEPSIPTLQRIVERLGTRATIEIRPDRVEVHFGRTAGRGRAPKRTTAKRAPSRRMVPVPA